MRYGNVEQHERYRRKQAPRGRRRYSTRKKRRVLSPFARRASRGSPRQRRRCQELLEKWISEQQRRPRPGRPVLNTDRQQRIDGWVSQAMRVYGGEAIYAEDRHALRGYYAEQAEDLESNGVLHLGRLSAPPRLYILRRQRPDLFRW